MKRYLFAFTSILLGCSDGEEFSVQSKDAGTDGSSGSGGTSGTGGTGATGGTAGSSGTGGEGGTAGVGGQDAGDAGDADAGSAGTGGEDGGDAEAEPFCDPNSQPADDPCVIHEDHGIFVAPTGTDNATCGTEASPCATVQQGMVRAKAEGKRVYACGTEGTYAESLSVNAALDGIVVYGGFDCGDWSYDAAIKTHVMPSAPGVALAISGLTTGITFEQFSFESQDAADPGTSSIGVTVDSSTAVLFRRCEIASGLGAKGADGVPGTDGADGDAAGATQKGKDAECTSPVSGLVGGGWSGTSQ